MSQALEIIPVKLFAGLIYNSPEILSATKVELAKKFSKIDFESEAFPFATPTEYYEKEMGSGLMRKFISFEKLVDPIFLAPAKALATEIEKNFASNDKKRQINIDPGYIDFNKVVLASYKYGSHKIYIGEGVWADLTLTYGKGSFKSFTWTFPDFREERYYKALFEIRVLYKKSPLLAKFTLDNS